MILGATYVRAMAQLTRVAREPGILWRPRYTIGISR